MKLEEEFISVIIERSTLPLFIPSGGLASCREIGENENFEGGIYIVNYGREQIHCKLFASSMGKVIMKSETHEKEVLISKLDPILKVVYYTVRFD